jgi:hypothetical protein
VLGNYAFALLNDTQSALANITPKALTVAGLSATSKVYDASAAVVIAGTAALTGNGVGGLDGNVIASDVVGLLGTPTGAFADKNAGLARPVPVVGLSLDGADVGNYTISSVVLKADITPKVINVSGLAGVNKVYDATNLASLTGVAALSSGGSTSLDGKVIGLDDVALGGTTTASFADKHVGSVKPITVAGFTLSGVDAGNYSFTVDPINADITPRFVSVAGTLAPAKVYDGNTVAGIVGGKVAGMLAGDALVLQQTGSFDSKNVGFGKTVTVANSLTGGDAGNYALLNPGETTRADITPRLLDIAGTTAANKVFDGNSSAQVGGGRLVGVVAADDVALTQGGAFRDRVAGVAKPVDVDNQLAGSDAFNYVLPPMHVTADILPDLAARKVAESLVTANSRASAHSVRMDAGPQVANLVTAAAGGSSGAYVLAALPAARPAAPRWRWPVSTAVVEMPGRRSPTRGRTSPRCRPSCRWMLPPRCMWLPA